MKAGSNRKPIPLHRPTNSACDPKRSILGVFEPDLNQNIQAYLSLEREKLRHLDKGTAKKIISTAERSLMTFMRSKAKINCFKQKNNQHQSYSALPLRASSSTQNIFDPKKLEAEIEHEQRKMRPATNENSPLIEHSLRQVSRECGRKEAWERIVKERASDGYCGYSSKKRSNKIIYY